MLAIPMKGTAKVDVVKPMLAYLRSRYSEADATAYSHLINDFQTLRNDLLSINSASEASKEAMLKYLAQLDNARDKFPVSESATAIEFTWADSLRPKIVIGQYSWDYEKASVLFNLAALESCFGNAQNRADEEGIRTAKKHYVNSASILSYIRDNLSGKLLGSLPIDLAPQGLNMAQACAFEMAQIKSTKPELTAQIAGQCADFYRNAARALPDSYQRDVDSNGLPWSVYFAMHTSTFDGVSFWNMSKVAKAKRDDTGSGAGVELGWLNVAENACMAAIHAVKTSGATSVSTAGADSLYERVHTRKEQAEQENRRIYFEIAVPARELPVIPRIDMAKITGMLDYSAYRAKDLFESVVPVEVGASIRQVEERFVKRGQIAREAADRDSASTKQLLSSLGLPGCLDAAESTPGVPAGLWERIRRTQIEGGMPELDRLWASNQAIAQQTVSTLEQTQKLLDDEAAADAELRSKFGDRWTAAPSDLLTMEMRGDHAKFTAVANVAAKSDASIRTKLDASRTRLEVLKQNKPQIDALVPAGYAPTSGSSSEAESIRRQLVEALAKLDTLHGQRVALCEELKTALDRRAAATTLVKAMGSDPAPIIEQLAVAPSPVDRKLEANIAEHNTLVETVKALHARFVETRALDDRTQARQKAIQELSETVDKFEELRSNLREGETFYKEMKAKAEMLRTQAEGMVSARTLQQRELQLEIKTQSEAAERAKADSELAARLASGWTAGPTTAPTNAYPTSAYSTATSYPYQAAPGSQAMATPGAPYVGPVELPSTHMYTPYTTAPQQSGMPYAPHATTSAPAATPTGHSSYSVHVPYGVPPATGMPSPASTTYAMPSTNPFASPSTVPGMSTYAPQAPSMPAYSPPAPAPHTQPAPQMMKSSPELLSLLDMGFDRAKAEAALAAAKNDVNQAVQLLLQNRV